MFEWQRKAQDILNKALVLVTLNVFENEFFVMRRNNSLGSSKRCRMAIRRHSPQCAVLEENNDVISKEEINQRLEEGRLRHLRGWDNLRTMDVRSNLP